MTESFAIWPTTKAILAYVWKERWLALRYAALPVLILIVLDVVGTLAGINVGKSYGWQLFSSLAALVISAPLVVTWYQSVVWGEAKAQSRPLLTFGQIEGSVIAVNIRVLFVVLAVIAVLYGLIAGALMLIAPLGQIAAGATAVVAGAPALFFVLMIVTRLSIAIAFAAAGQHIGLWETWTLTRPIAYSLTWVHVLIGAIGIGIAAAATTVVALTAQLAGLEAMPGVMALIASSSDTLFGTIYLLLATTLFGIAYRRLAGDRPAS